MIDRLVAIRVNDAGVLTEARRAMAARPEWKRELLALLRGEGVFEEVALLATCERLEVYGVLAGMPGVADEGASIGGWASDALLADAAAVVLRGEAAARHLLRVAAGLDSRIVGETHVLGQVSGAYREATDVLATGAGLAAAFESAARTGRRVRGQTQLGRLAGSYVSAAVARVGEIADGRGVRVGVLGSGALARELVEGLVAGGVGDVRVFARHTGAIAEQVGVVAGVYPLGSLVGQLASLDVVIAATSSPRALVSGRDLAGVDVGAGLAFIDLGMPANIDADVAGHAGVRLIGLNELAGPSHSAAAIAEAEGIIERELDRLIKKIARLGEKRGAAAWM